MDDAAKKLNDAAKTLMRAKNTNMRGVVANCQWRGNKFHKLMRRREGVLILYL